MTAAIETHEPEMACESRNLVVPHMQIGAERIGKHKNGGVLRPLYFNMDGGAIGTDLGHGRLLAKRREVKTSWAGAGAPIREPAISLLSEAVLTDMMADGVTVGAASAEE
jgi:hypothetical protein